MPLPSIAIVGATGAVGQEFLSLLAQRNFPHSRLRLLASPRSAGKTIQFKNHVLTVEALMPNSLEGFDIAFFSASGPVAREFAPLAVRAGCLVIDNSSAFRMDPAVPLLVPEINPESLKHFKSPGIIAVPNCSAIIALLAIAPLHKTVGVTRAVISTYQAVSGAGAAWMVELQQQARDYAAGNPLTISATGKRLLFNVFSHNTAIGPDGSNGEEAKILAESRKILDHPALALSATCVRVPVLRAHSESINLTFESPLSETRAREILANAPGVKVIDDRTANHFPEPLDASGQDEVFVGRIRSDHSQPKDMGLNLFVCGDQLRKGAALNAIQIAELFYHASDPIVEITMQSRAAQQHLSAQV